MEKNKRDKFIKMLLLENVFFFIYTRKILENRKLFQIYVIVILKLNLLHILFGDRFFKLDFDRENRE